MKFVLLCAYIFFASNLFARASGDQPSLSQAYSELERLSGQAVSTGVKDEDTSRLRAIRDTFVSANDKGAHFLLHKLHSINEEQAGRSSRIPPSMPLKYLICQILADQYPRLSAELQQQIRSEYGKSYNAAEHYKEAIQQLNWAVLRTGRDGIKLLLEMTQSKPSFVECRLVAELNALSKEIASRSPVGAIRKGDFPFISCTGSKRSRAIAIKKWNKSLEKPGIVIPVFPSPFDAE